MKLHVYRNENSLDCILNKPYTVWSLFNLNLLWIFFYKNDYLLKHFSLYLVKWIISILFTNPLFLDIVLGFYASRSVRYIEVFSKWV